MKVSDCCGFPAETCMDIDLDEIGICGDCGEHCSYEEEDEDE